MHLDQEKFEGAKKSEKSEKLEEMKNPKKSRGENSGKNTVEGGLDFFGQEIGLLEIVGPKAREIIEQDCDIVSACVARPYPLVVDSAKGSIIKDVDGREYIDFVAGIAVMNAGYSNPEVKAAI
ncbi:MAG TPA: aminotransferase class III-fold pyridoxal phosphate-dependent enzyme, partial [Methanosarcina sp.]|nr:aminotransferase class III-fold pyridoxal phosphate-dependent enzyme [Methanosarcina sp.]